MGCGNPPAMTAADEQLDKLSPTKPSGAGDGGHTNVAKSFGVDTMTSPSISSGYAQFRQHDMHGDLPSSLPEFDNENNRLGACTNPSFSNDSKADEGLINVKRELSEFHRESGILHTDSIINELHHPVDGENTVSAECLTGTAISSMGYESEAHRNFMEPKFGTATGYPIKIHGAEAKRFRVGMSPMDGKFSPSESSTSVLPHNFGATRNENDINIIPFPIRTPHSVDGSFLALGIGGGREIRSNNNFSHREIASKLEGTVPPQSSISQAGHLKNLSSLTELTGNSAGIQTNSGGLSSSANILAGSVSTFDEGELIGNTSGRLRSNQLPGFQIPQPNAQPIFSATYNNFVSDPSQLLLPFRSNPGAQSERVTPISLVSETMQTMHFSSQSVPQGQVHSRKSFMNVSSESPGNYPSNWYRGSSNHAQLGELIPSTEGRGSISGAGVHFQPGARNLTSLPIGIRTEVAMPGSSSVQPVGPLRASQDIPSVHSHGNNPFPRRTGFPVPNWRAFPSPAGSFPKRLGVHPSDFPTAQFANAYIQRPVRPPFAFGTSRPPTHLLPGVNPFGPPLSSGQQHHGMPVQLGQVPPVAKFDARPQTNTTVSQPSMKRPATENPPAIYSGQRRKIIPPPAIRHSTPYIRQPSLAPIPATVHIPPASPAPNHVKWQGFEESLKPTGQKCHLCKRDLSFTPEGLVQQPPNPPAVAVLPCGHTFHDHCLQLITPKDQLENPPCIPCALGET